MTVPDLHQLEVDRLLREGAEVAEQRWQGMSEQELREEIARHRGLVISLSHQMIRLGVFIMTCQHCGRAMENHVH